jgi:DNA-binding response OmpR family regulator
MSFFPHQQRKRPRILFAEDYQPVRDLLARLLRRGGYVVDAAENGIIALHLFQTSLPPYDIVITDHEMPHLDGLGLVQELRDRNFPGIIIVVSGGLSFANAAAYAHHQVDDILSKPVTYDALIAAIRASETEFKLRNG